jgi:Trk K+ transport system NAD-binding subunit
LLTVRERETVTAIALPAALPVGLELAGAPTLDVLVMVRERVPANALLAMLALALAGAPKLDVLLTVRERVPATTVLPVLALALTGAPKLCDRDWVRVDVVAATTTGFGWQNSVLRK